MNEGTIRKIALIPAYQPDEKLVRTARSLSKCGFTVVITDDGSGAEYRRYFAHASKFASVLSYPVNHGKGYALRTGIRYIMKKYQEKYIIVTVDSDGQHSPEDATAVLRAAEASGNSLVIGSRKFDGKVPFRSRFGNSMTRMVFHAKTGIRVSDTQTGLRAFSSDIAEYIAGIKGNRYEYEMNMLMQCAADNIKITEVPIKTIYIDDNSSSHFDPVRDSIKIYREIFRFKNKRESEK